VCGAATLPLRGDGIKHPHKQQKEQQQQQAAEEEEGQEVVAAAAAATVDDGACDHQEGSSRQACSSQQQQRLEALHHPFLPPFDQVLWRCWFDCCYPLEATAQEELLKVEGVGELVVQLIQDLTPEIVLKELAEVLSSKLGLSVLDTEGCVQGNGFGEQTCAGGAVVSGMPWMLVDRGLDCEVDRTGGDEQLGVGLGVGSCRDEEAWVLV
jgi:hypothetical protein